MPSTIRPLKPRTSPADKLQMNSLIAPEKSTGPAASPYDRRSEDRIAVSIPMRLSYEGSTGEISADGICTDISESGLAFHTPVPLYVGELVAIEFRQPGADPFRCLVRLLYKMADRYGAYFVLPG